MLPERDFCDDEDEDEDVLTGGASSTITLAARFDVDVLLPPEKEVACCRMEMVELDDDWPFVFVFAPDSLDSSSIDIVGSCGCNVGSKVIFVSKATASAEEINWVGLVDDDEEELTALVLLDFFAFPNIREPNAMREPFFFLLPPPLSFSSLFNSSATFNDVGGVFAPC